MNIFSCFPSKEKKLYAAFTEGDEQNILNIIQQKSSESLFDTHLVSKKSDYIFAQHAAVCGLDSIFRICCFRSSNFIIKAVNSVGLTILHCLCQKCNHQNHCTPENKLKCLLFFLEQYPEISNEIKNKQDYFGCTALHYLVKSNQGYLCERLLCLKGIDTTIV